MIMIESLRKSFSDSLLQVSSIHQAKGLFLLENVDKGDEISQLCLFAERIA